MPAGISSSNARTNSLQAVWLSVTSSERRSGHRGPSSSRNFRPLPAVDHCGLLSYICFSDPISSPSIPEIPATTPEDDLPSTWCTSVHPPGFVHLPISGSLSESAHPPFPYDTHTVWSSSGMFSVAWRASDTFYIRAACPGEESCESCPPVRDR